MSDEAPIPEQSLGGSRSSRLSICVGIGICAVLLALGVVATNRSRETANRTKSVNNVRMIGIAIQNYHDQNNQRFPFLCDFAEDLPAGHHHLSGHGYCSMFFAIIPHLDGGPEYNWFEQTNPSTYYSGRAPSKVIIRCYHSPLDPSGDDETRVKLEVQDPNHGGPYPPSFVGEYATMSYAANGMIFQPGMGIKSALDGTTRTIMLAERYRACKQTNGETVYNLWALGAYSASTPSFATRLPEAKNYPTAKPLMEQFAPPSEVPYPEGDIKGRAGNAPTAFANIAKSANAACGFQVAPKQGTCDPRIPQALQRDAMIVGWADASTSTIKPNISPNKFWALVTPNGNEVFGEDCQ